MRTKSLGMRWYSDDKQISQTADDAIGIRKKMPLHIERRDLGMTKIEDFETAQSTEHTDLTLLPSEALSCDVKTESIPKNRGTQAECHLRRE